jgi:hypothetical protein
VTEEDAAAAQGEFATQNQVRLMFVFTDFNIDKIYELTDAIRGIGWGLEQCWNPLAGNIYKGLFRSLRKAASKLS